MTTQTYKDEFLLQTVRQPIKEFARNIPASLPEIYALEATRLKCLGRPHDNVSDDLLVTNVILEGVNEALQAFAVEVVNALHMQPGRKAFVPCEDNHGIAVYLGTGFVESDSWQSLDCGWQNIYFKSAELANHAIETVGEDAIIAASKIFNRWGIK